MMIYVVEAALDVSLNKLFCPRKILLHIFESRVATPTHAETMRLVAEHGFVDALQYKPNNLLNQFVIKGRDSQWTHFPICFGNIGPSCRVGLIAKIAHFFNKRIDSFYPHSVNGLSVCSGCHISWICLYSLISQQIELRIVQIAVKPLILVVLVTRF